MPSETLLIVDDDTALRELIGSFLRQHGYGVREASDVPSMRQALTAARPDLIVLDLMMPGEDGLAALRTISPADRPPVIMLSAAATDADRIVGLELGADDYVPKPCNPRELLARVRAVLRRGTHERSAGIYRFAGWQLDSGVRQLRSPSNEDVTLTANEFRLLECLAKAGRKVISREELAVRLHGEDYEGFDRAVDLAVSRLQRKLAAYEGQDLIRTVRGEGYGMSSDVERS